MPRWQSLLASLELRHRVAVTQGSFRYRSLDQPDQARGDCIRRDGTHGEWSPR